MESKVIVSDKILNDAYNNAFNNLERMKYAESERLLRFVEENHYPVDIDMVDYAKVIIYSNSKRIDKAVELSGQMIERGLINQELELIIKDVHDQLMKQKEYVDRRIDKAKMVSLEVLYDWLEELGPSEKKIAEFIDLFCETNEEENMMLEYLTHGSFTDEDEPFITKLKVIHAKCAAIEGMYSNAKQSGEGSEALYSMLNKSLLTMYKKSDLYIFMHLYKNGVLSEMLLDERFDKRVRSVLAASVARFYEHKLVGRVKIKMMINGEVYSEYIDALAKTYRQNYNDIFISLQKLLVSGHIPSEFHPMTIDHFKHMASYTFPVINPMDIDNDKFICAFLYVVSNNTYKSQFNDIIEDVYKFQQSDLVDEIKMLEILILI